MKVLDFGVGLILDDVDGGRLTNSNETVGTARYMAPEQATQRNVTAAVDLYALGCVLYEMLVGAPPFDGELQYEVLNKHIGQQPTPVSMLRGEVPAGLEAVVARLLEKDPGEPSRHRRRGGRAAAAVRAAGGTRRDRGTRRPGAGARPAGCGRERDDAGHRGHRRGTARPAPELPAGRSAAGFDIFAVHQRLIGEYRDYTEGAAVIRDDRIAKFFDADLDAKSQWPDPWLSLNPFFADGGSVTDLVTEGLLHPECAQHLPDRQERHRDHLRRAADPLLPAPAGRHRGRARRRPATCSPPAPAPASRWPTSCRSWTGCCAPARRATGRPGSGRSSSTR